MEDIEKLGRELAKHKALNKQLHKRTREAEIKAELLERYLKRLPCPNKYCENGELWQWKWNGKSSRRRYKIGICKTCEGQSNALAAFHVKYKE